jgi:hypothetical protein
MLRFGELLRGSFRIGQMIDHVSGSYSAHVRSGEQAPVLLIQVAVESTVAIEGCGIPHLAKNERDVGHPGLVAVFTIRP